MKKENRFFPQAELLLHILPHIKTEPVFALKGGTAINLFVRDMPRLSVDIDLTYLPVEERNQSLEKMGAALRRIAKGVMKNIGGIRVHIQETNPPRRVSKLLINRSGIIVKVEPNEVIRGSLFPPQERSLAKKAEEFFELSVTAQILSTADLYGGKLCAALDRQHPRDFFDVKLLFDHEGLTSDVRKAFIVYLISHDRPMNELLAPRWKNIHQVYHDEFTGMTSTPISLDALIATRETMLVSLLKALTQQERAFLLSLKQGGPEWNLLGLEGIEQLPAVQWKLLNIRKMSPQQRQRAFEKLQEVLQMK